MCRGGSRGCDGEVLRWGDGVGGQAGQLGECPCPTPCLTPEGVVVHRTAPPRSLPLTLHSLLLLLPLTQ